MYIYNINHQQENKKYIRYLLLSILAIVGCQAIFYSLAVQSQIAYGQARQMAHDTGIKTGGNPYAIAVNPKTNMIYVVDKFQKKVSFIDGENDKVVRTVNIPNVIQHNFSYNNTDTRSSIAAASLCMLVFEKRE